MYLPPDTSGHGFNRATNASQHYSEPARRRQTQRGTCFSRYVAAGFSLALLVRARFQPCHTRLPNAIPSLPAAGRHNDPAFSCARPFVLRIHNISGDVRGVAQRGISPTVSTSNLFKIVAYLQQAEGVRFVVRSAHDAVRRKRRTTP
jgi:hypothetical protein